jgi:glycosyltransferase 2 family protein
MSRVQPSSVAPAFPTELNVPGVRRSRARRWIGAILRIAISLALVGWVWRRIDTDEFARQFTTQSPIWLIAAALATLAQIGIAAARWRQVLRGLGIDVRSGTVLSVTYIASFFNSWLLGTMGGDIARAVLAPSGERGRATLVHSVLLDRILTFAGLGLIILPLIVISTAPLAHSVPLVISLLVAFVPLGLTSAFGPVAKLIGGWRIPFAGLAFGLADSWRRLRQARGRLAVALIIAVISAVAISATAWCLSRAQHLDVGFVDFLMLMPPVVLLSGLPISVGGWGVRENAMIAGLATVGVGTNAALVLSVQMGGLVALLSLPGGALWLWRHTVSARPLAAIGREPS